MSDFKAALSAPLQGVLTWAQWEILLATLRSNQEGWFVYYVGESVPDSRLRGDAFNHVLSEIDQLLRRDHGEDYLGIVYVDNFEAPSLVKIYDPNNLGSSCGSCGHSIPPGWIISRAAPEELCGPSVTPQGRKRWWHGLLGFLGESPRS